MGAGSASKGRVLFVHVGSTRYGADRSLALLSAGLVARGWSVTAMLPDRGPLVDDLERAGVRVVTGNVGVLRRTFGIAAWAWQLTGGMLGSVVTAYRLARRHDIVHLNTSAIIGPALGARLARRPVILHLRESYAEYPRAWRVYAHTIGRMARLIIANSASTAAQCAPVGLGGRTAVIYNGLEFGAAVAPRAHAVEQACTVVAVGRLNSWRGQEVLVDALAELVQRGVDVRAEIAGDPFPGAEQFREVLVERIAARGLTERVALLGWVDDVPALLARATVFVNPATRPEPFGLAVVEAMAAGVACVATDMGGPAEIIDDDVTGLLVPPGDAAALAGAIEGLCADPVRRAAIARAGAAAVRGRFAIERTVDEVERAYESILRPAIPG